MSQLRHLVLFLVCTTVLSCSRSHDTSTRVESKPAPKNIDLFFIDNQLPQIRDAFCEDTLTMGFLKKIFKGPRKVYNDNEIHILLDSTDTIGKYHHTAISVRIDNTNKITFVEISFPLYEYYKTTYVMNEQMIMLFGAYRKNPTPIKDGSEGTYDFGSRCHSKKEISAHLNNGSNVRTIYMSVAHPEDSTYREPLQWQP